MPQLSDAAVREAAEQLVQRRLTGEPGDLLPEALRPRDVADALRIQQAFADRWCHLQDDSIGGWKCLQPTADKLIVAPIFTSTINTFAPVTLKATRDRAAVEPELAFYLARDLPAREAPYTAAEVDAAIGRTHLALELIHCRYAAPETAGFADNLADNLVNQGLFVGPEVDGKAAETAGEIGLRAEADGAAFFEGQGRHPNGAPRLPIYWLAEFLSRQGRGLQAGQVIITGSYAGIIEAPLKQTIRIHYQGLGTLEATFLAG